VFLEEMDPDGAAKRPEKNDREQKELG